MSPQSQSQSQDPNNLVGGIATSTSGPATPTLTPVVATATTTSIVNLAASTSSRSLLSSSVAASTSIPTPTPTPTPTPIHAGKSSGVSTGTAAGAAIGAAIVGALIAFLVAWFCLRPKRSQRQHLDSHSGRRTEKDVTKVSTMELSSTSASRGHKWEKHLPQSMDDSSLRLQIRTLFHQVELHVENFYSDVDRRGSQMPHDIQNMLEPFNSEYLPANVATLMSQTSASIAVIKHCLMKYIVSNISLTEMGATSFLPSECITLAIMGGNSTTSNKPGAAEAYSRWRVLTAYLRSETSIYTDNPSSSTPAQNATINTSAHNFSTAFAPWATAQDLSHDRIQNLANIMTNAAQLGMSIFSQPSDFKYIWTTPSDGSQSQSRTQSHGRGGRSIVVTPGFMKITDENARPLENGQVLVAPNVAQI